MSKQHTIRKEVQALRFALSGGDIQTASLSACSKFLDSPLYQNASNIGLYMAHNGEINPEHILNQALLDGKACYLPTLDPTTDNSLIFVNYNKGEALVRNRYQVLEPVIKPTNVIGARRLDVVLVPLVAIDPTGTRLGMGKGYYDRTFAYKIIDKSPVAPHLVGFAYEFQKRPSLARQSWDVPMDFLVTEQGLGQCSKTGETA